MIKGTRLGAHSTPFADNDVERVFLAYPQCARAHLLALRELIFETANELVGEDAIEETLRWGEPAYITRCKTGSTIRIAYKPRQPNQIGIYVNCQTTLVADFKERFGDQLSFEGRRAITIALNEPMPAPILQECIAMALTYHTRKKAGRAWRIGQ